MPSPASHPQEALQARASATPWPLALALLGLGTLLGLLLVEAIVRLSGLAPEVVLVQEGRFRLSPNPAIGYEPVPDLELYSATDSFRDYVGKSNSLGFRDREHGLVKPAGTRRIVLIGDSVAAGQGIRLPENAFPARVEQRLGAAGLTIELLNFAVTGYNTQQEVWTLHDRGLAFAPDLVLVSYCLNDRGRSDGGILPTLLARERQVSGVTRTRAHPWLLGSALFRLLRYRLLLPPADDLGAEGAPMADAQGDIYGDTVDQAMAFLARLRDEHGFRVLIVVFPRFGKLLDYRFIAEHHSVATLAQHHDFAYLDLLPAFQQCRREHDDRLAADSYHPTPLGHRCAARAIADHLFSHSRRLGIGPD